MKFTTDKIVWTDAMKEMATETLVKKLDRLIDPTDAIIKLTRVNDENIKVTLSLDSFRAQAINSDFYMAMLDAAAILKTIIIKHKAKYKDHTIKTPVIETDLKDIELISKEKIFDLSPISVDEAVRAFEQTDYEFYVYKDIDNDNAITIIYKRFNNTYGSIVCR